MNKYLFVILLIVLVVVCITAMLIPKVGDVNADGKISITDFTKVRLHCIGEKELYGSQLYRADVNRDGDVNKEDYDILREWILGLDVCGE